MNNKSKIVTFCTWTSIGSVLQSYGLKNALLDLGCDSSIMLQKGENNFDTCRIRSIKSFIKRCFQLVINKKIKSAFDKRTVFINNNLDVEYYDSRESFSSLAKIGGVNLVIAGSDQIQ